MKKRIDLLLVERGLAPSRERAQAMVLAGRVLVDEQKIRRPGTAWPKSAPSACWAANSVTSAAAD